MSQRPLKLTFLTLTVTVILLGLLATSWQTPIESSAHTDTIKASSASPSEEMYVPAGEFLMGCSLDTAGKLGCALDATPIHAVYLDAFYIDKTEVTNAQYAACVAAGRCPYPLDTSSTTRTNYYGNPQYANYPVIHVDWNRANAYCGWAGKRLPTEAEWEKAARGTDRRPFAWGFSDLTCDKTNSNTWYRNEDGELREQPCVGDTTTVGSYPDYPSPYGALDMTGNVREWVSDFYVKLYYNNSPYYNPEVVDGGDKNEHLVRGGSWKGTYTHSTTWFRFDEADIYETHLIGFRCARTSTAAPPTPTPTPTPIPTPTPYAAAEIGPEGGMLWMTYPGHITILNIPEDAITSPSVITLTYDGRPNIQGDLQGNNHFFAIKGHIQGGTSTIPLTQFDRPVRLTLGYEELLTVISSTLDLYQLSASEWTTQNITKGTQADDYLVADVEWFGSYGLLGETNRVYLPLTLRAP